MSNPHESQASSDYQIGGQAWSPFRPDIESLLATADHARIQPIYYGSNHCFLVTLDGGPAGQSLAVYKPARGEYPLYDFPSGTLYRREIGSAIVDKLLGWDLIPPTIMTDGRYGRGSLQLFIESVPSGEVEVGELQRLALLDHLLNNADRKPDHLLVGDAGKLWGIDHGLTFHVQPKLRTVLWHFAGSPIEPRDLDDLCRLESCFRRASEPEVGLLRELVSASEWNALNQRLSRLTSSRRFPDPRYKPVPYRW